MRKLTIGTVPTYGNPSNFLSVSPHWRGVLVWANWRDRRFYRAWIWKPIRYADEEQ